MTFLRFVWFATAVLFISAGTASAAELSARLAARNNLAVDGLKAHVAVLADDTFEGREAGKRGGRAAAGYLVEKLKSFGLHGAGDNGGYTQSFDRERRNILAQLPGVDPQLRNEIIVVCAHYDHVGYGNARNSFGPFGYIHNGADDNASGVAGVLESARVLASFANKLKRTVVFAFWDAEESGLHGSRYWLDHPTAHLHNVKCVINLDMIGRLRNDLVEVFGVRSAAGLRKIVSAANREERLVLDYKWEIRDDSDHATFFRSRIPVLMLHTGKHGDYHRPSDDVEKLNFDGMLRVSRVLIETLFQLADAEAPTEFRAASSAEAVSEKGRELLDRPYAAPPGRLGLSWHSPADTDEGIRISQVQYNTPAYRAGLRIGERITKWNDFELADDERFQRLVVRQIEPVRLTIVGRDQAEREVVVQLQGDPIRIGVSWAEDEAEPHSVVVKRVVPHSPAEYAGLMTADRIVEVDGRAFYSVAEFEKRLDTAHGKLEFTVDRHGILETLELKLDD